MARRRETEMEPRRADLLRGMKAICAYLGVSENTVIKWVHELDLPCTRTQPGGGGLWISSRDALDRWSRDVSTAKTRKSPQDSSRFIKSP